jgi:hypothetical protein
MFLQIEMSKISITHRELYPPLDIDNLQTKKLKIFSTLKSELYKRTILI